MTGIVLAHLRADDADTIEWVVKRRSAADETCRLLLTHSEPTVRGAAALGFRMPGMRHGPELPPEMRDAWAAAVTSVDISLRGMHKDYDVREVLEALVTSNPDVAEAWIQASLAKAKYSVGALPYDSEEYLYRLPREHKDRLGIRSVSGDWNRSQLLETLLGEDVEWAAELIKSAVVSPTDVLNALSGRVGPKSRGSSSRCSSQVGLAHKMPQAAPTSNVSGSVQKPHSTRSCATTSHSLRRHRTAAVAAVGSAGRIAVFVGSHKRRSGGKE